MKLKFSTGDFERSMVINMKKGEKENMKKFLESKVVAMKCRAQRFFYDLLEEERGDSNFVAIIVIIVIILAVAGIFRTQLLELVNKVFEQLTDFVG